MTQAQRNRGRLETIFPQSVRAASPKIQYPPNEFKHETNNYINGVVKTYSITRLRNISCHCPSK